MASGLEIASLVLAAFPIVINGLEHYAEGVQSIKDWVRFRAEYAVFTNALVRQKIFFDQNIEDLLSYVVDSEYDMRKMLDDPENKGWTDPRLETKLRNRLSGEYEYDCYMALVQDIRKILGKILKKIGVKEGKPHWTESSSKGKDQWKFELRRFKYSIDKSTREKLMRELERFNDDLRKLLGNSDRLEPMRRRRKAGLPQLFERFRSQASSFHAAICRTLQCDCPLPHPTTLLLPVDNFGFTNKSASQSDLSQSSKLNVFFPLQSRAWSSSHTLVGPDDSWCAAEVEMGSVLEGEESKGNWPNSERQILSDDSITKISSIGRRSISFRDDAISRTSTLTIVPKDVPEIVDLCEALKLHDSAQSHLGFIRDDDDSLHNIRITPKYFPPSSKASELIPLGSLLGQSDSMVQMMRATRLSVALAMAKALLQLSPGPWMKNRWGKDDVYFFRTSESEIHFDRPLLLGKFTSRRASIASLPTKDLTSAKGGSQGTRASLLSLGILVLELWFNQTVESQPFRRNFLGPEGKENEYTDFNTAQKWQEQALEEGGLDLHNLTRRCIYCAFGAASQDLQDEELRRGIYDEVIQGLERLLSRYEET